MIIVSFFLLVVNIVYKLLVLFFTYYILSSIKIILIVHGLYLSYCLYYIYPIHRRLTLSGLRRWKYRFPLDYKLESLKDHIINIGVLTAYSLIFIIGILGLRFYNSNRVVDLKLYYHTLRYFIKITPLQSLILNVLLLVVLVLLFKNLMSIMIKYIRHQLIRRHLYLYRYAFYADYINEIQLMPDIIYELMMQVRLTFHFFNLRKYPSFLPFPLTHDNYLGYRIRKTYAIYDTSFEKVIMHFLRYIDKISYTIHRRLLLLVIMYDIIFNDMILTHMYKILPYVFIYELLAKGNKFVMERPTSMGLQDLDMIIHGILYKPGYETMGELFVIDGKFYDKSLIAEIVVYYVYNDFRDIHYIWTYDYNQGNKKKVSLMQRTKMLYDKLQKQLDVYTRYWFIIIVIFILIMSQC